jgi:hypothetical protein
VVGYQSLNVGCGAFFLAPECGRCSRVNEECGACVFMTYPKSGDDGDKGRQVDSAGFINDEIHPRAEEARTC